jgi:hypothetical protein
VLKRVVFYLRRSDAIANGWMVVGEYIDDEVSGQAAGNRRSYQ